MYVFEDRFGRPLPLNMKVMEILVHRFLGPKSSSMLQKSRIIQAEQDKDLAEEKYFEDVLDTPNIYTGHDIIVPSNYPILPPNLRSKQ
jgi:hypothetical protein